MERIRIISKVPLVYDNRSNKSGIIVVEITSFVKEPSQQKYVAMVVDYCKEDYGLVEINRKTVDYTKASIDFLFTTLNTPIGLTDSYFDKTSNLLRDGLLLETQMNPVYESTNLDWEIME
jgi:hypothetical protein